MKGKQKFLVSVLFLIYLALLVWIILFKLQFNINDLDTVRSINLIPFYYDKEIGTVFHLKEVFENLLIFAQMPDMHCDSATVFGIIFIFPYCMK